MKAWPNGLKSTALPSNEMYFMRYRSLRGFGARTSELTPRSGLGAQQEKPRLATIEWTDRQETIPS